MHRLLLTLATTSILASACAMRRTQDTDLKYTAEDSTRVKLEFTTAVQMEVLEEYGNDLGGILKTDFAAAAQEAVDLQTSHLFGVFMEHPDFVDNPGGPRNTPKITLRKATWIDKDARLASVTYDFRDIFALSKDFVGKRQSGRFTFRLPTNPATIYGAGIPKNGSINRCTDEHYFEESDHWYFWNPYKEKCPYRKDLDSVTTEVEASFERLPSNDKSYPYYNDLYADGKLDITYLVGIDESTDKKDLGRKNYTETVRRLMEEDGFIAKEGDDFYKKLTRTNKSGLVVNVYMRLVDQNSDEFLAEAGKGMTKSEIFMYGGHSGLGYYLDPTRFKDEAGKAVKLMSKNRQQILYFDGCSTFAYYNQNYLKLKHPEINWDNWDAQVADKSPTLDIFSTTVGSPFEGGPDRDTTFIRSFANELRPSWQTIVANIYNTDPELSALVQVNGDSDNPKTNGKN